jgi:uncharacterized membrane protein YdjX (TVP38/TMEM64 family)
MKALPVTLGPRALGAALLLILLVALLWWLPLRDWLFAVLDWVRLHPFLGRAVYLLVFVVATVLMVPGSLLVMSGGFLFGLVQGVLLVSLAVVLGATAALLVARGFGRAWVQERLHNHRRFLALDQALQSRGLLVVMLTRMSLLLPYNLLNYAYGLTGVGLRPFVIGTGIGMLPAVGLYVYLGTMARSLGQLWDEGVELGSSGQLLMLVGLGIAVAVVVLVHRTATRLLEDSVPPDEPLP